MAVEPSEEFLKKNYRYFQEWHHWHDKATSLHRQATVLYRASLPELRLFEKARRKAAEALRKKPVQPIEHPHPDLLPTFSLFGSALENAFKGVIVSRDSSLISEDKLSDKLKSHKLVDLADAAGIALSPREKLVLEWLTEVVIWKARYSVPTGIKFAGHFFHRLDDVTLDSARKCRATIDEVLKRAKRAMPRRVRRVKFDVLVLVQEDT